MTAFREEEDREAFSYARTGVTADRAQPLARTGASILRETYAETRPSTPPRTA